MSKQHISLHRNNRRQLHNPAGPAWEWADGTAIYALEGIRVPEHVIKPEFTITELFELENTEQRRVAADLIGWNTIIEELKIEPLDKHSNPHYGALYQLPDLFDYQDGTPRKILICRNNSPHPGGEWATYGLDVEPSCSTVIEAQASLWQIPVDAAELMLTEGVRT